MRSVALDSVLLVLFLVGKVSPDLITGHKRLREFDKDDFALLISHVGDSVIVTTPNTVTETSNLITQGVHGPTSRLLMTSLYSFCKEVKEKYISSEQAVMQSEYFWLGIADSAWLALLDRSVEFLTVDLNLFIAAEKRGLSVRNFNHLRDSRGH